MIENKIGTPRVQRFQRTTSKGGAACDRTYERIFLSAAALFEEAAGRG